ncbi:Vasoactive intestinal polypeptide receptor 2 [Merluccius polli]|uniref:Vasoactive intestinal polypeptide receptor 2 n=1 Tax=Merluccius polli TaxID=89951 RepID=A0AA47P0Z6_MERPO|nr:Vasoactive intestinal polypeptide receptor 2 [Merluccius polli]
MLTDRQATTTKYQKKERKKGTGDAEGARFSRAAHRKVAPPADAPVRGNSVSGVRLPVRRTRSDKGIQHRCFSKVLGFLDDFRLQSSPLLQKFGRNLFSKQELEVLQHLQSPQHIQNKVKDHNKANGRFSVCQFHWELQRSKEVCQTEMNKQPLYTKGCHTEWDNISCWQHAAVGDIQNQTCPPALLMLFGKYGTISRNCTETGWSDVYPSSFSICWSDNSDEPNKLVFYRVVKIIYTLGHSLSLIALLTSTLILSLFRRLHCTRNYIHLNLFLSFILRAVAVLVKDTIIFSHSEHADCTTVPSLVGCKISMVFFNYFIMANFFWLLVEGLYLHMLLMVMHNYHVHLSTYMLIGWGIPFVFTGVWVVCKICLDDILCWEKDGDPTPKRVLNWPIMASVIINFVLFINIIRILVQKIRCSDVGGNDKCQYRRLAKSTLLLIPLFGVNYMVFIYLVEPAEQSQEEYKMLFDLGLGSFQGLVVAILYCFLNSEVQGELKRKWRSLSLKRYVGRDYRLRTTSVSHKDADNFAHLPRNSRAQSILQTETSML